MDVCITGYTQVVDPTGYTFKFKQGIRRDPMTGLCFNVSDLAASIKFYTSIGMTYNSDGTLSYGDSSDSTVVKLTQSEYPVVVGTGYGQIAVSTPDVYVLADTMKKNGITPTREPGPVPGIGTKITAVRDPDGYKIVFVDATDFEKELV